jgi:hypothetical protein
MPRSRGWTLRLLEDRGISLSRVEENCWLGRVTADPSERGAFAGWRDEPTDKEERGHGDDQ